MPKLKTKKDAVRLKSFTAYWIRNLLFEFQSMSPELRKMLGQIIGDLDLQTFKDLETLEATLRKLSLD